MFDGSFRTNKREINLAGASASSRSSRKTHLNVARQQRLARAQAKAKLNGAKCLQRSWRGNRGRKSVAIALDDDFQALIQELSRDVAHGSTTQLLSTAEQQQKVSRAASLLAFRMSPALLPFFASRHIVVAASDKKKWGAADDVAEEHLRQDSLSLESVLQTFHSQQNQSAPAISPIVSRKIISITLVLLRQSIHFLTNDNSDNVSQKRQEENQRLIQLLDYLLDTSSLSNGSLGLALMKDTGNLLTDRPSDYYMGVLQNKYPSSSPGWMINIFLCFRDFMSFYDKCATVPMDVDGSSGGIDGKVELQQLLKWCCQIVLYLASTVEQKQEVQQMQPLMYQQGLALLASVLFTTSRFDDEFWINEQLTLCFTKLDQVVNGTMGGVNAGSERIPPSALLVHYLSSSMGALSASGFPSNKGNGKDCSRKGPGLMSHFAQTLSVAEVNGASCIHHPWMEALRDTLSSREFLVLSRVLSANALKTQTQQSQELLVYSIPTILQYTLQYQQDLAILSSFAAQGEDITSWFSVNGHTGSTGSASLATAAAAAALGEDVTEESDDDDDDQDSPVQLQQQPQQQQPRPTRDNTTTSTGRYSRQDLQTLPKLDALYQTDALRAKKATVDRLQGLIRSYGDQVTLLVSLADKIGKGELIQQLGNSLFSSAASSLTSLSLLSPPNVSSLQSQAQCSFTSALATIMTTFSGIKAGRNAASPLLAKLAFNESFLYGMWELSSANMQLITSQIKVSDTSETSACEVFSSFCDTFSHNLLAVDDDDFLKRYYQPDGSKTFESKGFFDAREVVLMLKTILNDLYWVRPVLASDITSAQNGSESNLRLQRARLLLSGTKLWNSLYERWCRLYRTLQFCSEDCWWFPHLASRGQHDNNPIIHSQVTTLGGQANDDMDDSSVESANMDEEDEAAPMSANDAGGDALASTFRDPKMARVLTYIPQAMPFSRRVTLFNSLLESDKLRTQDETTSFREMMRNFEDGDETEIAGRERVTIRRDALYSDSKQRLNRLGKRLRKKVQITFVNRHGQQEAGIDGGGVFKEFLDDLIKDAFLPETVKESGEGDDSDSVTEMHPDFFSVTPLQTLKVNTNLDGNHAVLSHYEFLGRVLGKAIYESILVEPQFCLPFLNKLLGKQNSLDDLKNLDPEYYKNLKSLRHMSAQEIKDLGLTFELHDSTTTTIELMPGGSRIPVTKENVIQYIHLVSHQKMNVRGSRQTSAFLRGFRDIVPAQWVRLFSAYELQKLISGDDAVKGIDVKGMASVMRYSGGFHPSQPIIQWLWQVVDEMTPDQQQKFLKFMTSCSRQPLLGFSSMVPAPCIQQIRLREDDQGNDVAEGLGAGNIRLPTSSTCMNLLKLPKYTSKEMLREKLLYAIEAAAGFELS